MTAAVLLAALAVAAPVPKGKAAAEYLPSAVGTKWEYVRNGDEKRVYVEEVTESAEKDGVRVVTVSVTTDTGDSRFEKFDITDGDVRLTESTFGTYDPPMVVRKAGMKADDTWTSKYPFGGDVNEVTCTVGKAEKIKVPAGEFTAFPVSRVYSPARGGDVVFWYADGVGLVKQTRNGKPEQELKSFTAGKGAKK